MTPLRPGRTQLRDVSAEALETAVASVERAVRIGGEELPPEPAEAAATLVEKARRRTALVGGHTIVALAGATGSGKSSLFNALVGDEVATIGARRPTTSATTAATWGADPAAELLDWLAVPRRHQVDGDDPARALFAKHVAENLDGLVLLDLPDFDSRVASNRAEAERILGMVDLFVWVTDPQKYADSRLHDDYLTALATHDSVMLVVLNQIDLLTPVETGDCLADLRRLLRRDGVPDASVIPVSAVTGQGISLLRQRLVNILIGQRAARDRLAADLRVALDGLRTAVAPTEPTMRAEDQHDLMDALARSAGVSMVAKAAARDYRRQAVSRTGWPLTRWLQMFRAKPLRKLWLDDDPITIREQDMRAVLGRSSIPPPTPAAQAEVALATRRVGERARAELPERWAEAVDAASFAPRGDLADALDQAVLATPLRVRVPLWWRLFGALQIGLALTALGGVLWYAVRWVLGLLAFPVAAPPRLAQLVPLPLLMVVGGLVCGLLLALLSRTMARVGARRRAARVEADLRQAVAEVAQERVIAPVAEVISRHRETREELERAAAAL